MGYVRARLGKKKVIVFITKRKQVEGATLYHVVSLGRAQKGETKGNWINSKYLELA